MNITQTHLPGVIVIQLKAYGDSRGFFREILRDNNYRDLGLPEFTQYNHSRSTRDVLRGLHYQRQHPQGKLISVMRGAIWDVVADVRPHSPTFKQWFGIELSDSNHCQLYIPPGYAHGFLTLTDEMDLLYACTDYYQANDAYSIIWNDPDLNITWPVKDPILSDNDAAAPKLATLTVAQLPS